MNLFSWIVVQISCLMLERWYEGVYYLDWFRFSVWGLEVLLVKLARLVEECSFLV